MPGTGRRIVVVPPVPALLEEYASLEDPVADLRSACTAAVAWLDRRVRIVAADDLGRRVGESLTHRPSDDDAVDLLVLANGTACRSEKAPGHLDPRAADFDAHLGELLATGDVAGLAHVDNDLAESLLTSGLEVFRTLEAEAIEVQSVEIDHAEDPFGVMYWVVRWQCAS
ncbi:hypothetical protein FC770_00215 [Nocardioides jishulii]|uniref:Uncharacterized protein n=2 Tax=Nocardioides jishulii TaxID=2575440 RepID=A0A4U2YVQ4_9ACTN|nr:hypothetical protein FCL41_02490 [Nocardioides jishulii]TKI64832.1 hypothetical protein FC770_00215 [Nocardioides jishulii]